MITILNGNALDKLKEINDKSIQCVVTSPPYWNLRNYNHPNQIGQENKPEDYIKALVKIFKQVKRVLKDDGVVWLNLGDTYLKKQLVGIPFKVAFALQNNGWFLRQDIIWSKPNSFPESIQDRCTKSHEYIFMLSKKANYYYNNQAIKEDSMNIGQTNQKFGGNKYGKNKSKEYLIYSGKKYTDNGKKNKRDVWEIPTSRFAQSHFATFPTRIPEICIKASSKKQDIVLDMFAGAGTTGLVADRLNRNAILIELNKDYAEIMYNRLKNDCPMFTKIKKDFNNDN